MYFFGDTPGTGKTTLAMLIAQEAMRRKRSVAIYTGPELLTAIRMTYEDNAWRTYEDLFDRLRSVDLLILDDLAVAKTTEWVLEQLYTVVNDRYQDEKAIILTADVGNPDELAQHIGPRTHSRLIEMCSDPIALFGEDHRVRYR